MFCYENRLSYPPYLSDQKFKNYMNLLMVNYENKLHYVCIKAFSIFMFNKTRCGNKKNFVGNVYSVLVVKEFSQNIERFV